MSSHGPWSLAITAAVLGILLAACGLEPRQLRVVTDRPDLVFLADDFAARNPGVKLDVRYVDDVSAAFRNKQLDFDVAIARNLLAGAVLERAQPLDKLLEAMGGQEADYLDMTFGAGVMRDSPRAIVLSFDLPAFMARADDVASRRDFWDRNTIDLATVRDAAAGSSKVAALPGVSLVLQDELPELICRLEGASLGADGNGSPVWDVAGMNRGLEFAREWLQRSRRTMEAESDFARKFRDWAYWTLLDQGVNRLVYAPASVLLREAPEDVSRHVVQWLVKDRRIPVLPGSTVLVFAESCRNPDLAGEFTRFLLDPAVQEAHVERMARGKFGSFAFLDGFSTNRYVYEQVMPRMYPVLALAVPPGTSLELPALLPLEYSEWASRILRPFLIESIGQGTRVEILADRTREWLLQKGLMP